MLIFNGKDWVQFVGTKPAPEQERVGVTPYVPCVSTGPLGGHDTVARTGPVFLDVLREFLADPTSSYVDGTAAMWRMRLSVASGGVL